MLGPYWCMQAFFSCSEGTALHCCVWASLAVERGLLSAWASAVAAYGLGSCSLRALEHRFSCGVLP